MAAGCGGSATKEASKATSGTPSLNLMSAGQACAQVQMVNDELHGPGKWAAPTYGQFGEEIASLADESVPGISDALKSMSDQAIKVGTASDDEQAAAASEWATRYQSVADICARTNSPIGRLN